VVILRLTYSFAASYDNVGTYEFKKVTRVRIPISPPRSLNCGEIQRLFIRNTQKMPVFRDYSQANRTAENGLVGSEAAVFPAFLQRAIVQSGFNNRMGECNAIRTWEFGPSKLTFVGALLTEASIL
jgi:hypothetical protein